MRVELLGWRSVPLEEEIGKRSSLSPPGEDTSRWLLISRDLTTLIVTSRTVTSKCLLLGSAPNPSLCYLSQQPELTDTQSAGVCLWPPNSHTT